MYQINMIQDEITELRNKEVIKVNVINDLKDTSYKLKKENFIRKISVLNGSCMLIDKDNQYLLMEKQSIVINKDYIAEISEASKDITIIIEYYAD